MIASLLASFPANRLLVRTGVKKGNVVAARVERNRFVTETFTPLRIRGGGDFGRRVREAQGQPLGAISIDTVQVNIGLRCNLACHHCHVESSPSRKEEMSWETMRLVLDASIKSAAPT